MISTGVHAEILAGVLALGGLLGHAEHRSDLWMAALGDTDLALNRVVAR